MRQLLKFIGTNWCAYACRVKNELQHLAMNQKKGVTAGGEAGWSKAGEKVAERVAAESPGPVGGDKDLFKIREMLNGQIDLLDQAVKEAAQKK